MIGAKDFSKEIRKALKSKGIEFAGITAYKRDYANGSWGYETAYKLNDNGTMRVREYQQVVDLAEKYPTDTAGKARLPKQ